MHELFHTEDCGVSLICRCCRASICERRLARSDRLRIERNLWPIRPGCWKRFHEARDPRGQRRFPVLYL